jgi:hypothetical protein
MESTRAGCLNLGLNSTTTTSFYSSHSFGHITANEGFFFRPTWYESYDSLSIQVYNCIQQIPTRPWSLMATWLVSAPGIGIRLFMHDYFRCCLQNLCH